jgi:hypothetical protein
MTAIFGCSRLTDGSSALADLRLVLCFADLPHLRARSRRPMMALCRFTAVSTRLRPVAQVRLFGRALPTVIVILGVTASGTPP